VPAAYVLLVDDDPAFLDVVTKRLEMRGLTVVTDPNGQAALRRLEKDRFIEVVVLDLSMPGLDGLATLQGIRERRPLVEVILLTGHGDVPSAVEAMKQGAFDYLTKPCDVDLLVSKIEDAAIRKWKREDERVARRMMWGGLRRPDEPPEER